MLCIRIFNVVYIQGISPRISPFVGMRDIGGLLAGFALTTIVRFDWLILEIT